MKYFHIFGSKCQIFTDKDQVDNVNPTGDEGIFLGYSSSRRAYRVFNSRIGMTLETINVKIDGSITEEHVDIRDDAGTSSMITDEATKEEICEFTSTEPVNSQSSRGLSTEGKLEKARDLTESHPDEGNITEVEQKISNADGCVALRET